ncbi:MAG: hypothetical protein H6527_07175 [Actinobacteria bacterium]|nr:hypothetical protein [Actinomycetota bacterium]
MDLEDLRLLPHLCQRGTTPPARPSWRARAQAPQPGWSGCGLRELAAARHLVLDADGRIVMAHPFSAVPLGFSVMGSSTLWWGGCAWRLAMPHLLTEPDLLVATVVRAAALLPGTSVPLYRWHLTPVAYMWDDVVHTCGNQRIFCSEACVDAWLDRTGQQRGYVMDLPTLWRLASDWYTGRLDRGYTRREPAEAADYLSSVGLTGSFWGV